jgi:hypothetical protein
MDPINVILRSSKTPAASAPVGGEMSAAEIDDNFTALKTASEQLDAEKLSISDAEDAVAIPSALLSSDIVLVIRAGVPYQATLAELQTFIGGAPSDSAPAAFTVGQWTSTPGDAQIVVDITALPSDGGSAITALQYTLNSGSTWTAFAGTGTGSRTITGLTNDTAYPVQIRAVNAIGAGAASDTKSTTPVAAPSMSWVSAGAPYVDYAALTTHAVPVPAGAQVGDYLVLGVYQYNTIVSVITNTAQSLALNADYASAGEVGRFFGVQITGSVPTSITVTFDSAVDIFAQPFVARGVTQVAGTVLNGDSGSARSDFTYNSDATDALAITMYVTGGATAGRVASAISYPGAGAGSVGAKWADDYHGIVWGVHSGSTGANNAAVTWSAADTGGGRWLSLALKA